MEIHFLHVVSTFQCGYWGIAVRKHAGYLVSFKNRILPWVDSVRIEMFVGE